MSSSTTWIKKAISNALVDERWSHFQESGRTVMRHMRACLQEVNSDSQIPSHVIHKTEDYYCKLYEQFHPLGARRNGMIVLRRYDLFRAAIAACLYYAYVYHGIVRTPYEICRLFHIPRPLFTRGCRSCAGLDLPIQQDMVYELYIRFGNILQFPYPDLLKGYKYLKESGIDTSRYTPIALAGGLLAYLAADCPFHVRSRRGYGPVHRPSLQEISDRLMVCITILHSIRLLLQSIYPVWPGKDVRE